MANHQNSSIRVYAALVPALKAPAHVSPGQRPGWSESIGAPCKGAGILRPCRAEELSRARSRGVAPGWHAPRRWRVNLAEFSIDENCYGPIYQTGSSDRWISRFILPAAARMDLRI